MRITNSSSPRFPGLSRFGHVRPPVFRYTTTDGDEAAYRRLTRGWTRVQWGLVWLSSGSKTFFDDFALRCVESFELIPFGISVRPRIPSGTFPASRAGRRSSRSCSTISLSSRRYGRHCVRFPGWRRSSGWSDGLIRRVPERVATQLSRTPQLSANASTLSSVPQRWKSVQFWDADPPAREVLLRRAPL